MVMAFEENERVLQTVEKQKCRWCTDCEFFKDCYEIDDETEYNREADAAFGIADNCDCYYENA